MKYTPKTKILVGIPASGKTFYSHEFLKNNSGWVKISRDDLRFGYQNKGVCDNKIETIITEMVNKSIVKCLSKGINVIVDATHVKKSYINDIVEVAVKYSDIEFEVFDIELEECLKRNSLRERKVSEDVIHKMNKDFIELKKNFDFKPISKQEDVIIRPNYAIDKPKAILADIDGTLAINTTRSPFDWHRVGEDEPNIPVIDLANFYANAGYAILVVSGRDSICRKETIDWFRKYNIDFFALFMRKENDMRKDSVVKREIYENEIKDKWNVIAVVDDRLSVLEMWHKLGLFTINVNQGMKEF